jgi:Glycine zipper 2TM domain
MKMVLIAAALIAAAPAVAHDHDGDRGGYGGGYRGDGGYRGGGYQGYRGYGGNDYRGFNPGRQPVYYAPPRGGYYAPRGYGYGFNAPFGYRNSFYRPVFVPRPVIYVPPRYYGSTVIYNSGFNNGYHGPPVGYYGAPAPVYGGYYPPPVVSQVNYGGGYYDRCRSTGAGALIGAIAGGLVGNGVAGRYDRGLGTVVGAGVGAVTGTAIERNSRCGY